MLTEKRFMEYALDEARKAYAEGETPVGAAVVRDGELIAAAHNRVELTKDASAHAELIALKRASEKLGTRYLDDCVLYVTMEPCPMCAGACLNFRIGAVVFGAYDANCGAFGSALDLGSGEYGGKIPVIGGAARAECEKLLTDFFRERRNSNGA